MGYYRINRKIIDFNNKFLTINYKNDKTNQVKTITDILENKILEEFIKNEETEEDLNNMINN